MVKRTGLGPNEIGEAQRASYSIALRAAFEPH